MQDLFALMNDYKTHEPTTTEAQWKEFFEGSVWADLKGILYGEFVERVENLTHPKMSYHADMMQIKGNVEAIVRIILELPTWVMPGEKASSDEKEASSVDE